MKYIKQLDSVRAIAVLLVIISHWIPKTFIINRIPNGELGVDVFFVLSGFLITHILLSNRQKAEATEVSKGIVVKNFYIRRALRIFPIYYITIFVILLLSGISGTNIVSSYPYFLTYSANFYFFQTQTWEGILSHLWSLSVEEQFYLLWPALMLYVKRKYLIHTIILVIFLSILIQFIFRGIPMINYLTFTCFDAFGMGALLAWYILYKPDGLAKLYKYLKPAAVLALIIFIGGIVQTKWPVLPMLRTVNSILALFLITYILFKQNNNQLNFIFNNRLLIFIGKVSYGVYLYHNILPHFFSFYMKRYFDLETTDWGWFTVFIINFGIVIGFSWLSWALIEKPILYFKKHFEYNADKKIFATENLISK